MLTRDDKYTITSIGLMSGSSLDGVDGVLMAYENKFQILAQASTAFSDQLRNRIDNIRQSGKVSLADFCELSTKIADEYLLVCSTLIDQSHQLKREVNIIGAHGQTLWHQPPLYSLQICNYARLAHLTGISVVGDIRNADIANGGTGAPLAPIFHSAAFLSPEEKRAIINLGGIANITVLSDTSRGWDMGPGMTLMDSWYREHKNGSFDIDGNWAQQGHLNKEFLASLLKDAFFSYPPPKSTGQEVFNMNWLKDKINKHPGICPLDVQNTLAELTATLCKQTVDTFAPNTEAIYLCGGGTKNGYLRKRISELNKRRKVLSVEALGIKPEYVECCLMGWLAVKHILGEPVATHQVTGSNPVSKILGALYPASQSQLATSRA
ncbi:MULTISPECIES: anhydro-N-acetylmuramic acid kinase [Candidatus Ichthyocystis]|uniref:Anhydro-N-acetylmuramic acid kinase n=1 Tax=Candidatus Ichthyocystis hellenicum TaxID=1561003 RepID=A0A0S4M115_9BURK|nr:MULTISPECIES: anhydro-N-acetylmuramic acid kinase [Ichthyocystis]CUT17406.1 Anhydro-N-acetylmuramic acid kinase [Candidatus Ichthyocystis hellenicum]